MTSPDEYRWAQDNGHPFTNVTSSGDAEELASPDPGIISTLISEAADGVLATNTLTRVISVIDDLIHDVPVSAEDEEPENRERRVFLEPEEPSKFHDFEDSELSRLFSYFSLQDKKTSRLVCLRWKLVLDQIHLRFHRRLTRYSVSDLEKWPNAPVDKLIVCNILDVKAEHLAKMSFMESVKEIELESKRVEDYEPSGGLNNPTIGEENLVKILKLARNLEQLTFNSGALGNFGLELLEVKKDANQNEIVVGWQWPAIRVSESMSAMTKFLCKILGEFDESLGNALTYDFEYTGSGEAKVPSDPPILEVTYKTDSPPPFPAFTLLATVRLEALEKLSITVQPTKNTEKIGLIALLHVVTFPSLRTLSIMVQEYVPDEALYRSVFRFISKHHNTVRHLTFINPVLSTKLNAGSVPQYCVGLEKVKLRSFTVAWEVPIGLELYWEFGHYLLECQRRLTKLELHTTSVEKAEIAISNNFRYLTEAIIEISDTGDSAFDCSCFTHCAKLRTLVFHVSILVQIINVCKLPDTIQVLHWDAMYTRDDVRWFSRFLILAKAIYLYHDKDVPMDIFVPFTFADFVHFVRLPCLEQLYLPRIHIQDPRVNRFCERHAEGLTQSKDFFHIDRQNFKFQDAFAQFSVSKTDCVNNNFL